MPPAFLFTPACRLSLSDERTQSLRRAGEHKLYIYRVYRALIHQTDRFHLTALPMATLHDVCENLYCRYTVVRFIIVPSQSLTTIGLNSAIENHLHRSSDILTLAISAPTWQHFAAGFRAISSWAPLFQDYPMTVADVCISSSPKTSPGTPTLASPGSTFRRGHDTLLVRGVIPATVFAPHEMSGKHAAR